MKKASIIMAVLACAIIAAAYTNSVPISTNTRSATEKWTAIRFEPALPPTPANAASKFLDGNREWQTVSAEQIGALTNETDEAALAALAAYAAYWPRNATASSWFNFVTNSGAITITGYNIAGGTDVVIPDYINGWPVTEIGANAFMERGVTSIGGAGNVVTVGDAAFYSCTSLTSVSLPQVQTVGGAAFEVCTSLASVSLPQVQTVEDSAFRYCALLASVSLPQVQTVGEYAFISCGSLASVSLPQVQTVRAYAFSYCGVLTSLYFGNNAPTIEPEIFAGLNPNQVTNYVTNPQATGWGATFAGMPVVRLPLYADAITLNGDTITEWPVGGGETSIIAPLYDSGTNVTVTSTQSVYSVAVTGAGPVGIDWSGLSLDGTGRAEVTLRLNVTEWGGTNVTFSPSLTFDQTPEILVTGVWEVAASTVDGVTTRVRQTWPLTDEWATASYAYASGVWVASLHRMNVNEMSTNSLMCVCPPAPLLLIRPGMSVNANKPVSFSYGFSTGDAPVTSVPAALYGPFSVSHGYAVSAIHAVENPSEYGLVQIWIGNSSPDSVAQVLVYPSRTSIRPANANERAAYEAGWRP